MFGDICLWVGALVVVGLLTCVFLYSVLGLLAYCKWYRRWRGGKWYLTGYIYSYWLRKRPDGSRIVLDFEDYTER